MTTIIDGGGREPTWEQLTCNAALVRSAIYLQRNELDKALSDIAGVLLSANPPADANELLSLILAKQSKKAGGEEERATFANKSESKSPAPASTAENPFDALFGEIRHRTMLRLVPELSALATDRVPTVSQFPAAQPQAMGAGTRQYYPLPAVPPQPGTDTMTPRPSIGIGTSTLAKRPVYEDVNVAGNETYESSLLKKVAGVKAGDAVDPVAAENGRQKIEKYYGDHGKKNVRVSILEGNNSSNMQVVYVVDEGPHQRILWINIVGNSFVSAARLRKVIGSHSLTSSLTAEFNPKQVDEDVEKLTAYYRSFGFFHARIGRELDHHEKQNWVTITFVIDEGPRYSVRNVTFLGNRKLDDARLTKKLKLLGGQHFDANQQKLDLQTLRDEYGGEGYVLAKIEAEDRFLAEPDKLDIAYKIDEGDRYRIGRLNIETKGASPYTKIAKDQNRTSVKPADTAAPPPAASPGPNTAPVAKPVPPASRSAPVGQIYRIEPPDVIHVEVTRFPGGKSVFEGHYLVGPDGTINLRDYGVPHVAGLTDRETEKRIADAVARKEPVGEYSARVEVASYNSKVVYVIVSTDNKGDQVVRLSVNGSNSVASAILQVNGAAAKAAKESVWLAHPKPKGVETEVKEIDWRAIVERGSVEANLPLLPGDRIYIGRQPPEGRVRSDGSTEFQVREFAGPDGTKFFVRYARMSYSQAKDQMIFEGDKQGDAELYKLGKDGAALDPIKAQKIIYFKKSGEAIVNGFRSLEAKQPPEKPGTAGHRSVDNSGIIRDEGRPIGVWGIDDKPVPSR